MLRGRLLLLLAVVALLGIQGVEALHSHDAGDRGQHCLLCQGTAETSVTDATLPHVQAPAHAAYLRVRPAQAQSSRYFTLPVRGPPRNT